MKQDLKGPESGLKMHFQVMSCKVNVYGISVIPCYACMVCDAVAQNCFKVLWSVRLILKYHMMIKRTTAKHLFHGNLSLEGFGYVGLLGGQL